ncbi:hypothetical protein A6V39_00975 [Candidatus Mycoplasma haematobovis]|uniref:Lipoprotein n=1 Tax=Candidatus Mycoplasma haematobovis TaxID=432608 RepID=A0A1A9QF82_9MOLU|nr:hypothetical protein [Candidatus Mycoplasma haematobovis]OAL10625.1 hypothetical protein A6V39_00975 [Candidatus Mycoplasma haematobovis]
MFRVLIKCIGISGMCGCAVLASTSFTNEDERESPHRVSLNSATKKVEEITKLEDIDVWGKQNGCNFVFIDNWKSKLIYNAEGFATAKGGKEKKIEPSEQENEITWEQAIVRDVKKFQRYCGNKLRTFSFQYNSKDKEFFIANPDDTPAKIKNSKPNA